METEHSSTDGTQQASGGNGGWIFPAFLAVVLLLVFGFTCWVPVQIPARPPGPMADWAPSPQPTGETVELTIDFGNGAKKEFAALPWQSGMTVAGLLEAAREYRPGIDFTQVGAGEGGFLSSLDGLANEGADGRNWLYQVDARHAHVSFCLEKLKPGMHVLWMFTDEIYNTKPE